MNIAICDDDFQMTGKLEKILSECLKDAKHQYKCDVYFSGERLADALNKNNDSYHIYLLDVEMAQMNGLQLAQIIRQNDKSAIIIFITSHKELMQCAFEVNAFHYLLKPLDDKKVRSVFMKAVDSFHAQNKIFQFVVKKQIKTLYLHQIEYFESQLRKIAIYTDSCDKFIYYGTMKEVLEKANPLLFVQIHNSFIVNLEKIHAVEGDRLVLFSGATLNISKKYHRQFTVAYGNFGLMRME